mmetsp:Transcript_70959/g.224624  ORF Transcript_70959/g.224624 Transcript_70959/m.224624 type:complete len:244 (+) Transcript_70959:462-1193(+)
MVHSHVLPRAPQLSGARSDGGGADHANPIGVEHHGRLLHLVAPQQLLLQVGRHGIKHHRPREHRHPRPAEARRLARGVGEGEDGQPHAHGDRKGVVQGGVLGRVPHGHAERHSGHELAALEEHFHGLLHQRQGGVGQAAAEGDRACKADEVQPDSCGGCILLLTLTTAQELALPILPSLLLLILFLLLAVTPPLHRLLEQSLDPLRYQRPHYAPNLEAEGHENAKVEAIEAEHELLQRLVHRP